MRKVIKFIFFIVIVTIIFLLIKSGMDTGKQMLYPLRYENFITEYSNEYNLDKYLVMGVIKAESNYVHDAHSGKASGLMQITDDTGQWIAAKMGITLKENDLNDPKTSIRMGCYYLNYLINHYKDVDVALAAYNGGMGNVSKWLKDKEYSDDGKTLKHIPFRETRNYVERVNEYMEKYRELYP